MKEIKLTERDIERFLAKIGDPDARGCTDWNASRTPKGYGQFSIGHTLYRAHRVAYTIAFGGVPDDMQIDHTCLRPQCVNPEHLRPVTQKQNMEHKGGAYRNNGSGIRGVTLHRRSGKWRVRVRHDGQEIYGGLFDDKSEAEKVATKMRLSLFTHNELDRAV